MDLEGKHVVIIGGSSGMGLATAADAAAAGAKVTIVSSDQSRLSVALDEVPLDEARRLFDVRFWGAVTAVRHAVPRISVGGSIVLTSGTVAVRPSARAALMAAGAAAIEGLTRGLAVELAPVRVNAVRPGAVHTPMWDAAPEPQRSALLGALAERTITKTVGEPDQIAAAHLYLMGNRFVTGTVLTVDGGAVVL